MSITITIEAQTAAELADLVRDLAGTIGQMSPDQIPDETVVSTLDKSAKQQKPVKENKPVKAEEPKKEATPAEEVEDAPEITDEELRKVAREVGTTDETKAAIKALLAEYGVKNVTAVPKEIRPQFLEGLKEIGE